MAYELGNLCLVFRLGIWFIVCSEWMATEGSKPETQTSVAAVNTVPSSCRKKKSESATFLEDVRDHIDEFIHASMDEHKTCFKKTIQKVCFEFLIMPVLFEFRTVLHCLHWSWITTIPLRCLECRKLLPKGTLNWRRLKANFHSGQSYLISKFRAAIAKENL